MKLKTALYAGLFVFLGLTNISNAAQESSISISPVSGQYLYPQKFDISIDISSLENLPRPLAPPYYDPTYPGSFIRINAFVNGVDATSWFNECMQEYNIPEQNSRLLLCKVVDHTPFQAGTNVLRVEIFDGMEINSAEVVYEFQAAQLVAKSLPYRLNVQGKSVNTSSGVQVTYGQVVYISATGTVNTWPSNPSFPISTPRGTQVCASTSTCIMPNVPVGALMVKIGEYGRWMYAGTNYRLVADRPGELMFGVNDKSEQVATSDNIGSYQVTISK
jgi:hypothetical protein